VDLANSSYSLDGRNFDLRSLEMGRFTFTRVMCGVSSNLLVMDMAELQIKNRLVNVAIFEVGPN
jgi:hypothetical protein